MDKILLLFLVFFPIIIGIINFFVGRKINKVRELVAIIASVIEFLLMILVFVLYKTGNLVTNSFIGLEFKADGFRSIYAIIASFMWMCTIMFSKEYMHHYENKDRYYLFYLLTLGATIGVFYSNTLWTTFMFFEMMSLTSFVLVIHEESKDAIRAALTYLAIAIISGMILLMGLFLIEGELHTLNFDQIYLLCKDGVSTKTYIGGVLLLFGFGAKAGMFPLHIWLPKAHPIAPAPASALLSGILTKTGIFGIIVVVCYIFPSVKSFGVLVLILAVITMMLGAILAVFSINFKRTLACSSMSQIGFILVGLAMMILLGEENVLAFEGSFLHMVNHSLIKLSLFMIAGVIFMNIHKLNLNDIRGWGRNKTLLKICFALAMLGIMGVPLFNGYISKTLIHESIVEYAHELKLASETLPFILTKTVEYCFLFSGGLTIAYMLKIFICVFFEENNDKELQAKYDASKKKYMNKLSTIVICASSFILPFLGCIPWFTSNRLLPSAKGFYNVTDTKLINYFSLENLKGGLISIAIGVLVYFFFIKKILIRKDENKSDVYVNIWPEWLDLEKLYALVIKYSVIATKKVFEFGLFVFKKILKAGIFVTILLTRVFADLLDGIIYIFRRYILRQYKYAFNYTPISYRLGRFVARITHEDEEALYADKYFKLFSIQKDILDTFNATFSFDFLVACMGIVVVFILAIVC